MINRPIELVGILQLFWDPKWAGNDTLGEEAYFRASTRLREGTSVSPHKVGDYLAYLDPHLYKRFDASRSGKQMSVSLVVATRTFLASQYTLFQIPCSAVEAKCGTTYIEDRDLLMRQDLD